MRTFGTNQLCSVFRATSACGWQVFFNFSLFWGTLSFAIFFLGGGKAFLHWKGPPFVHLLRSMRLRNASESRSHDDVTSRVWWCRGSSVSSSRPEAWWSSICKWSAINLDDVSNPYIGNGWKSRSSVGFKDFFGFLYPPKNGRNESSNFTLHIFLVKKWVAANKKTKSQL